MKRDLPLVYSRGSFHIRVKRGFTLIELLISIGILSILAAGVVALIGQGPAMSSRDSRRRADLEKIASALELYRNDMGTYPPCAPVASGCEANATGIPALNSNYVAVFPVDPVTARKYVYRPYDSTSGWCTGAATDRCVTYTLCAALEKDTTAVSGLPSCALPAVVECAPGLSCSYRIRNP